MCENEHGNWLRKSLNRSYRNKKRGREPTIHIWEKRREWENWSSEKVQWLVRSCLFSSPFYKKIRVTTRRHVEYAFCYCLVAKMTPFEEERRQPRHIAYTINVSWTILKQFIIQYKTLLDRFTVITPQTKGHKLHKSISSHHSIYHTHTHTHNAEKIDSKSNHPII